jgi:hypothetical protein
VQGALVVHCRRSPYDVYVGRGCCPNTGRPGEWGNPFSHKPDSAAQFKVDTVEEAVENYNDWVLGQPELVAKIKRELRGKILGCWCKHRGDELCHGDVLARIANAE